MLDFSASTENLKKALSVVALATSDVTSTIRSHTLFKINNDKEGVVLYSTDEDKIAQSYFTLSSIQDETDCTEFTADPKRILALIADSDSDEISFNYNSEEKTLKVYASDNNEAFISYASFDPKDFLNFDLTEQKQNGVIDSSVFQKGIKYIQGFLPKDNKNKKYSNIYIEAGVIYGSNGYNRIGAFKSSDLDEIPEIALRKQMLSSIVKMIEKTKIPSVILKSSNKYVTFSSEDGSYCFGFRHSVVKKPKLPIDTVIPESGGFKVNPSALLKKLKRLSLSSWEDLTVRTLYGEDNILKMETLSDRPSHEALKCERLSGDEKFNFLMECANFETVLNLFQTSEVLFFIKKSRCTIYSIADIIIEEKDKEPLKKRVITVAVLTLMREV